MAKEKSKVEKHGIVWVFGEEAGTAQCPECNSSDVDYDIRITTPEAENVKGVKYMATCDCKSCTCQFTRERVDPKG